MADEPMSDERLAEIRQHIYGDTSWEGGDSTVLLDRLALLHEVERLRAREAAAMAIVREVATEDTLAYEGDAGDDYRCVFCGGHFDWRDGYEHTVPMREQMDDIPRALIHAPDCPVTKARALLADEEH